MTIIDTLKYLYRRLTKKPAAGAADAASLFRFKYSLFKELLDANTELLNIITDIEQKLKGDKLFTMGYIQSQVTRAAFYAFRMVKSLNVLSENRYPELYQILGQINQQIKAILAQEPPAPAPALILPLDRLTREAAEWVGGKAAHLGELHNRLDLPVPGAFAVTTAACRRLLAAADLEAEIHQRQMQVDPDDPGSIDNVSREIQELILAAPLPEEVQHSLDQAYRELAQFLGKPDSGPEALTVSLRSSAIGEDSDLSFAGQYVTVLNVTRDQLGAAYKQVVASLFSPRAVAYRLGQGIRDEELAMAVLAVEMIASVASGVIYTRNPAAPAADQVLITAVWGLGPYAVDGRLTPDTYVVHLAATPPEISQEIAHKPVQLVNQPGGGVVEKEVPPDRQRAACLTASQVLFLAQQSRAVEKYYGLPQDLEWALAPDGRLLFLQSRPLQLPRPSLGAEIDLDLEAYPLLAAGGAPAQGGVGCGPAFILQSDADLVHFPSGAVLVAKHSSPKFALVMRRAQAIVTEAGSISGHMASVAREMGVPTLLGVPEVLNRLTPGQEITVDADHSRIYAGRVPELLERQPPRTIQLTETPVYRTLQQVATLITPLHLIDPQAPEFRPDHCRTLHDLSRLVHEFSYQVMFQVSDLVTEQGGGAVKLEAPIPLDLFIIDLGRGLREGAGQNHRVRPEDVTSRPFQALLRGMLDERLRAAGPRPVQFSGFLAVMREQMLAAPGERFGDRSYAIIGDKYLNFSSRVGYHYSILDSYCDEVINNNYLTFSFKGGAADEVRKNRRVRAIALVLSREHLQVEVVGDQLYARFQKYPAAEILAKLEMIGRLLQFTRQLDMLMHTEASVFWVAENFLAGNYHLEAEDFTRPPAGNP